jgi:hypothetical protein
VINSFRLGQETLRISERTSRKNFVSLTHKAGLLGAVATFSHPFPLPGFFMNGMGFTSLAVLLHLNAIRIVFLVLIRTVIPVLTLGTF